MFTRRQEQGGHLSRLPNGKAGPHVRSSDGKFYMSLEDLLTYPAMVHERILPECRKIRVTWGDEVVLVVSLPESGDFATES